MLNELKEAKVIPVLRNMPDDDLTDIVQALVDGGAKAIEITLDEPNGIAKIKKLKKEFPELLVGAGTVFSIDDAEDAIKVKADFLVSPIMVKEVLHFANNRHTLFIPGVFTPTEMVHATIQGASMVNIFPASALGPEFIASVLEPFEDIPLMCSSDENVADYMNAGAEVIRIDRNLITDRNLENKEWNLIKGRFQEYVAQVN
ncbi:bifunctional 4-hydroxy-2-oxoglutarate aldolase/2-dehydro-3-deoxy-phosphogluconate aldolase [Bacillus sp. Marseille-Q3570]|uniref:bifunctional 4-hydroxy-2-oxoglutarate aldolase/2-dehydro-3-deoxy-phosphogluconate aldolase n=1 Tax=Bacillus sp. Marseille-Q3570 TaxID=2963522 RepID=UPI0021B83E4E|nr:bifunctional 4-hydroxy-2-oxoglutarate aldolase/2-dehydro-3-deoxy-phosphogluconate aldolase [Bacillus sp. Marseille-Q3570]